MISLIDKEKALAEMRVEANDFDSPAAIGAAYSNLQSFYRGLNLQVTDVDRPLLWLMNGTQQYTEKYRRACEAEIPHKNRLQCFVDQDTRERILTVQPYVSLSQRMSPLELRDKVRRTEQIIHDSQRFAQEWGLQVNFRDSFYDPERCILVEYTKV
jgi:hypothetical protein